MSIDEPPPPRSDRPRRSQTAQGGSVGEPQPNDRTADGSHVRSQVLRVSSANVSYWLDGGRQVFEAVCDASFTVSRREMVAIVGPSGCGKSSLLAAIAGLIPFEGEIILNGHPVSKPSVDSTLVFQRPALLPWMRVIDNVAYGLRAMRTPKNEALERAHRMLDVVGLTGYGDRFPYQLSGGMQQRVGLARAMVARPSLLLLDEPFAAVDALTRETLQNDLLGVMESGERAGVIVTHQLDEAVLLADRIVVMSRGPASRIKEIVSVDLPRPRTAEARYSARFGEITSHLAELLDIKGTHGRGVPTTPQGDES